MLATVRNRIGMCAAGLTAVLLSLSAGDPAPTSPGIPPRDEQASIREENGHWVLRTAKVEKHISRDNGLWTESLRDRTTGQDLTSSQKPCPDFQPGVENAEAWTFVAARQTRDAQGELQLDLTLKAGAATITKHYVVHPGSSVIREWLTIQNTGTQPIRVTEPHFLSTGFKLGQGAGTLDFHWITGAENQPGCWNLKTEALTPGTPRVFDSYDPFPGSSRDPDLDGIDARILLNDQPIWPESEWAHSRHRDDHLPFDLTRDVKAGDRVSFVVNRHQHINSDTTAFDPTIAYDDGESHTASTEFSEVQGEKGWRYGYIEDGQWHDLTYHADAKTWKFAEDNPTHTPFVSASTQHPHTNQDAVRQWTAPKSGRIHISGSVCNTGGPSSDQPGGHRMGSSSYAPWFALLDRKSHAGVVIGWDYMGHWKSEFNVQPDGSVSASLRVAGHSQTLAPGESIETPRSFTALFQKDLDEAGNEVLDWQYRYMWDYTRPGYFPALPMLGYWYKGTGWGQPGVTWVGGEGDIASQFTKILRAIDLMRTVGGDVYHRDWGWWDHAGDWNGPDFGAANQYLRKYDMRLLVYAFLYTVDAKSKVAREHPDWVIGETLDMSRPEVVASISRQLDDFHARWGDFAWRNDSTPTAPRNGDDTILLAQDQNFRAIIQHFLDKYPGSSFQSVNGGGNEAGYDYVRLSSMLQFSDAAIGVLRNQYASLLFPPDKVMDNGDAWNPNDYNKATWRGLLTFAIMTTGDTWDKAKLEGVRELFDIYHYLAAKGVVGRWVKVYRPIIEGDDPTMYFERLSGDRKRAIIITKHTAPAKVVIKPKGLLADETYSVTFQESEAEESCTGSELMASGIVIEKMAPGELIYLNMPMHPGSKRDREPPSAPTGVTMRSGENMNQPGVEVAWQPATDNSWVSYYEVIRNGQVIDRISKGTFAFDHSVGADTAAAYKVRAVDGAGNRGPTARATGASGKLSQVLDDTDSALRYAGDWKHQADIQPAHGETLTASSEKGASVGATLEGRRILVYVKLGDNGGKAEVRIDDGPPQIIDTYCSDDVWGYCALRQDVPAGPHTVKITLAGEHGPRSKGNEVSIDGLRAEP